MVKPLVLDNSIVISWYAESQKSVIADKLISDFASGQYELLAPHFLLLEFGNTLLTLQRRRIITESTRLNALNEFLQLPIQLDNAISLMPLNRLAIEFNLSMYDAAYFFLAEQKDAILATRDKVLISAAKKAKIPIYH